MIANPAIPSPGGIPHSFTLNDLRVHDTIAEEQSSTSALTLSGMVLAVVLAITVFIWLDPLHLFAPTEASPPASSFVPSAEPERPIEKLEIIAPLTPAPVTKSVEVPLAPASAVRAPTVPEPGVRPRAASIQSSPKQRTAPPVLLTKPEEKTDAPIVLKLGDDTKNAPTPAPTNDQAPVSE